jgi:hypothetical protein
MVKLLSFLKVASNHGEHPILRLNQGLSPNLTFPGLNIHSLNSPILSPYPTYKALKEIS